MNVRRATYRENVTELERIVRSIQDGDVDLDVLSTEVERAKVLISACRKKLRTTDEAVKRIMADAGGDPLGNGVEPEDSETDEGMPDLLTRDRECPPEEPEDQIGPLDEDWVFESLQGEEFADPFASEEQ